MVFKRILPLAILALALPISAIAATAPNSVPSTPHIVARCPVALTGAARQAGGSATAELGRTMIAMAGSGAPPFFQQSSAAASCYPALSLVTNSLPQEKAGVSFSTTLVATGGQPPYVFSGTSLPQGLSLNSTGDLSGTVPSAGNYSINVSVSDSLKNTVTAQLALSVLAGSTPASAKPVIASLTATPSTITAGQSTSVAWKVSGQTKLTLNGVTAGASPRAESPAATITYTLVASNAAGSVSKSVTVTVNAAAASAKPVIASLTATPSTITAGQSTSVAWKVSGQTKLTLNGVTAGASPRAESPAATITYTLVASNAAGSVSKSVTVTVNAAAASAKPVIASLTATPSTITAGQSTSVAWKVSGQTKLTLNGVTAGASPRAESPAATITYTLVASNAAGSVSKSVTVTVNAAAPPPPPPPTGSATGTALTACTDLTKSGSYYLANDVSSAGTCFGIDANNITLNLNGHTITYGTGGGSSPTTPTPAIEGHDCWWTSGISGPCGSAHAGVQVYGGTIRQSPNAAPFSHVFQFGQSSHVGNGYIHDLTATFQSVGSQFFHGEVDGGGYKIQNNVINDNVTNIQQPGQTPLQARAVFQGYVIHTDEDGATNGNSNDISGNTFNGSPQGGVADGEPNSQIYNNQIHLTSRYSNDYGVIVTMNGQNVHDNIITGQGRGLDGESSSFILNHNTINVAEQPVNTEYGGCELDGTYGIRVKNYNWPNSTESGTTASTSFQITNNTVTTPASACPATALDLTDMTTAVTGKISGNTFSAPAGAGGLADALGFEADNAAAITFSSNSFAAPTCVLIGGNGDIPYGAFTIQAGQTWSCPAGPTVAAQDDTYGQTPSSLPALTIQDSIPNPTVSCVAYSTATVKIGSSFTKTCDLKGN